MSNFKYQIPFFISAIFAFICMWTGRDAGYFLLVGYAFGMFTIDFVENIIGDKK